jgi:beta-lactamase superfamily II metal-dependent hydrolase
MLNLKGKKLIAKIIISAFVLLILNFSIYWQNRSEPNILKVYFLNVGQGDSILIETPNGRQTIIDAGPNNKIINELSEVVPFFDRTIDIIIPTHSDLDHIAGFPEILRRFNVKNYFDSGYVDDDDLNNEIRLLIQNENGINVGKISRGDNIILDKEHNISLEILWPPANYETKENNNRSIVARLDYSETSFLFTGDAGFDVEKILLENSITKNSNVTNTDNSTSTKNNLENILDVDILKAGHHGSKTASSQEFLEKVTPELTIISAGKDNKFGHPNPETLDRLNTVGSQIKNTAEIGRILIKSDGVNYWSEEKTFTQKLFERLKLFDQTSFFQSLVSTVLVNSS